ncbi:hypothetical protein EB796_005701 [Bugula neritina]|uniref:Uncharacterized protein n=1 Tax=Bugula neritina TaxID=10212 RepID=A0A7J7KET1_BUGNE|nr:hypothetical protein EB796_005701 [Bugula neritina]
MQLYKHQLGDNQNYITKYQMSHNTIIRNTQCQKQWLPVSSAQQNYVSLHNFAIEQDDVISVYLSYVLDIFSVFTEWGCDVVIMMAYVYLK